MVLLERCFLPRWARPFAGVLVASSVLACGLRSDPISSFELDTEGGDDVSTIGESGDPNGAGSCAMPIPLALTDARMSGHLQGGSFEEGWCGHDDGPEDVYVLDAAADVDVTISIVAAQTEVTDLTLRVQEDGCAGDEGVDRVCATDPAERPYHFFARAGHRYSITMDSESGSSGNYAFDVVFGWPLLELCDVHDEAIEQVAGGTFIWENELGSGQGRADGRCGGPGRENMFPIAVTYPGNMFAEVYGSGGFDPVLSLRISCGGGSELMCSDETTAGDGYASLATLLDPTQPYFLVVDQVDHDGGFYTLNVYFD